METHMFRLSRIECPRGNLFAFTLLVAALLTFGAIAAAGMPNAPAEAPAPSTAVAALVAPAPCGAGDAAKRTT